MAKALRRLLDGEAAAGDKPTEVLWAVPDRDRRSD
jgi:hypothetical protein